MNGENKNENHASEEISEFFRINKSCQMPS